MLTFIIIVAVLALLYRASLVVAGVVLLARLFNRIHESNPRLSWGLAVGVVLIAGLGTLGVKHLKQWRAETRAEAAAERLQRQQRASDQSIDRQAQAAEAERQNRAQLIERWQTARGRAIEQWRQDLIEAHAVGGLGAAPPMLSIDDTGSQVMITNRANEAACVLVTRIATRDGGVMARCSVGAHRCVSIQAGATVRWPTLRTGNSELCLTGSLEFRVGNVDHPNPSWWSQTALNQFGGDDPAPGFRERQSDAALMTEIVRLEQQIEDRMRVER